MLKKLGLWLLTDAGKKFSFYTAGTVTTGVLVASYLPQTIFLNKYKEIISLYKNGVSVAVPPRLDERFEKVLDLLEVDPQDKHLYKPFMCYGFDVMSIGSAYSKYGVLVGLPVNFTYENINMVDKSSIKVKQESIVWDSDEGKNLQESLVFSENAQMYAIAKEVKFRQTPKLFFDTTLTTFSCYFLFYVSNYLNKKFDLYSKPRSLRVCMYTLVGLFSYGTYALWTDTSQIYLEKVIDEELREMKLFADGGKEYYNKILERNKALRKLLGKDGESLYSITGNENYLLRNKHLPIIDRKIFFEEPLKS